MGIAAIGSMCDPSVLVTSLTPDRLLDSILEQLPAMVFVKDARELRFVKFNRAGEELLGVSRHDLIGKCDHDLFPAHQADQFVAKDRQVLANKRLHDIPEEPIETPQGTRWLHTRKIPILNDAGEPEYLLGISMDITEGRRANRAELAKVEHQLRQAQKLEAVGRLAAGVAHDFNNLLTVILSLSELVAASLEESDPRRQDIADILSAGQRAEELTAQLLAFSRQQVLQPRIIDLNQVVSNLMRLLPRLIGEDIALRIKQTTDACWILADPTQVEQVAVNLVVNARDAMPTGGELTIETEIVDLDEEFARAHLDATAGCHAVLVVSDTGEGMDSETKERIFEPFFTTKDSGKGTGLGLSTVFGIVRQSGGIIWVYSEQGLGTTFKAYFPLVEAAEQETNDRRKRATTLSGTETILLVEDESRVRSVAKRILETAGYKVLAAAGPREAMTAAADYTEHIDLLLTDVVMPDMGGRVLAETLSAKRANLKVLFMSGYTGDTVVRHGVLESSLAFLQKPLTPDALLRKVRESLEDGS